MSRRLQRQANRLQWKPYRSERKRPEDETPPEGQLWVVDADTHAEIERVDPIPVDSDPIRR